MWCFALHGLSSASLLARANTAQCQHDDCPSVDVIFALSIIAIITNEADFSCIFCFCSRTTSLIAKILFKWHKTRTQ